MEINGICSTPAHTQHLTISPPVVPRGGDGNRSKGGEFLHQGGQTGRIDSVIIGKQYLIGGLAESCLTGEEQQNNNDPKDKKDASSLLHEILIF